MVSEHASPLPIIYRSDPKNPSAAGLSTLLTFYPLTLPFSCVSATSLFPEQLLLPLRRTKPHKNRIVTHVTSKISAAFGGGWLWKDDVTNRLWNDDVTNRLWNDDVTNRLWNDDVTNRLWKDDYEMDTIVDYSSFQGGICCISTQIAWISIVKSRRLRAKTQKISPPAASKTIHL